MKKILLVLLIINTVSAFASNQLECEIPTVKKAVHMLEKLNGDEPSEIKSVVLKKQESYYDVPVFVYKATVDMDGMDFGVIVKIMHAPNGVEECMVLSLGDEEIMN